MMKQETLDEIIERLAQDCLEEYSKRNNGGSADTEEYIKIEKYERTIINKDDDNR